MKGKGFTLIELLAVIVILAIIAVIATPIIVGIIEDSRKAAFERSVEGIIHATDIDFGTQETLTEGLYEITNGVVNKTLKTPIKNIDGFNGTIKYDEKGNSTYAIYNDKWCILKDVEGEATTLDYASNTCKRPLMPYDDGYVVYFDVVNGVGCSNYHEDNSKTGYNGIGGTGNQTSCLKFYAFNYAEGDTKVNLLLDHNTTTATYWTDSSTTSTKNGPITVLTELQNTTAPWNGTITPEDYTVTQTVGGTYTIDYDNEDDTKDYKARLITAQEIAQITGADTKEGLMFNESTARYDNNFYFDSLSGTASATCKNGNRTGCSYGWLYDRTDLSCKVYGCYNNSNVGVGGYWSATSTFGGSSNAWYVYYIGKLGYRHVNSNMYGVRPVIEVLKSNL